MEKAASQISEKRVKIHTGTGEKLAGLHSQIDFEVMCALDNYIDKKNTKILKKRDMVEVRILKAAKKYNFNVKETNTKLAANKEDHPQLTKRSLIETALADYFKKYPV